MKFRIPETAISIPMTALAAGLAVGAHAESYAKHDSADWQQKKQDWQAMRDEVIKATDILDADVSNGLNTMGDVRELVLSKDNGAVKYVLYEVPYPYSFYGGEDGFVRFDNAAFEDEVFGGLEVRIDDEEKSWSKERLRLTRGQADDRLVSNIIGEDLSFHGDEVREIENLLIDREDGTVTHLVIASNADSLFNAEPRAIPMDRVEISERGDLSVSMTLEKVDEMQRYAPEFLK